jgi:hypothetical protein
MNDQLATIELMGISCSWEFQSVTIYVHNKIAQKNKKFLLQHDTMMNWEKTVKFWQVRLSLIFSIQLNSGFSLRIGDTNDALKSISASV